MAHPPPRQLPTLPCLVGFVALMLTPPTAAQPTDRLCAAAAERAARIEGVPLDLLQAIARTESGTRRGAAITAWPWTINVDGTGAWFGTRSAAEDAVRDAQQKGHTSIDVGCFQINLRWHGAAFRSVADMFDPDTNARYAAGFLVRLYREFGDWSAAVGAYHSRRPDRSTGYVAKVEAALTRPIDALAADAPPTRPPRHSGASAWILAAPRAQNPGSLVGHSDGVRSAFIPLGPIQR